MPDLVKIRDSLRRGRVQWRLHAQERMMERGIWREEVTQIVLTGEVIEANTPAKPFPSFLIYGSTNGRLLHVLIGWDELNDMVFVVTAYVPDDAHFEADMKTRKRRM